MFDMKLSTLLDPMGYFSKYFYPNPLPRKIPSGRVFSTKIEDHNYVFRT